MKIKSIKKITLKEKVPVYDVIQATPNHNFLIESNTGFIVSHNCGLLDEVEFVKGADENMTKSTVMKIYRGVKRRMESRFMKQGHLPGVLFLVSSKKSEMDFLNQYIEKQKGSKGLYIVDQPLWKVKPKENYSGKIFKVAIGNKFVPSRILQDSEDENGLIQQGFRILEVPIEHRNAFELDIDSALTDIAGIAIANKMKFIGYDKLSKNYTTRKNPFTSEVLIIGLDDELEIKDFFNPDMIDDKDKSNYGFIHLDTSLTGDRTGLSYVCYDGVSRYEKYYKNQETNDVGTKTETDVRLKQLFSIGIQAPTDSQISFQKTREFIYYLREEGFNICNVSADGYQSADTKQLLKGSGIETSTISLDITSDGYVAFKSIINEKRIDLYDLTGTILEREILELERNDLGNRMKIDHPQTGSKDIADSLAGACQNALSYKGLQQYMYSQDDIEILNEQFDEVSHIKDITNPMIEEMELLGIEQAIGIQKQGSNEYVHFVDDDILDII